MTVRARYGLVRLLVLAGVGAWLATYGVAVGPLPMAPRCTPTAAEQAAFPDLAPDLTPDGPWVTRGARWLGEKVRGAASAPPDPQKVVEVVGRFVEGVRVVGAAFLGAVTGEGDPANVVAFEQAATARVQQAAIACRPEQAPLPPTVVPATAPNPGGWVNGRIPLDQLCTVPGGHARCDAAAALASLSAAFQAEFGRPLTVTDAYRDYAGQVACRAAKGSLCARPGTSNHGWGVAFDLGGGINRFGTPEHEWMRANGPAHGFVHPSWARQGGSKPEAWHWEFSGPVRAG